MFLRVLLFVLCMAFCCSLNEFDYPAEEHPELFQGDIILFSGDENSIRNLAVDRKYLWPNKTLIYEFSSNYTKAEKDWINAVLKVMENQTCVRFKERTNEEYYIFIENDFGCASHVGYSDTESVHMFLALPQCAKMGVIQHEFLHSLGFWHEHTRFDRDDYINVQWDNIIPGREDNFVKVNESEGDPRGLPYDFSSVLHYRLTSFSRNRTYMQTIIPLENQNINITIGQRERFSQLDIAKLNRLYECGIEYYLGDDHFKN